MSHGGLSGEFILFQGIQGWTLSGLGTNGIIRVAEKVNDGSTV
jgi:hypothetical protein